MDSHQLPYRLIDGPPSEPVLTVDGSFGAAGLELSHWPGNRTPSDLRHRLSTGSALAFTRLEAAERAARLAGLTAIANNHYDTDGLCAAWVLLNPGLAETLAEPLLATAAAGDFFQLPDEAAFARDVLIQAVADRQRSPIATLFAGLDDQQRLERASEYVLVHLGEWLSSDLGAPGLAVHEGIWGPALERLRRDRERLAEARVERHASLDLTVFELRPGCPADALPGRHALFGTAETDRVLLGAPSEDGSYLRLILGTRSWFDLDPDDAPPPRFPLAAVRAALEELEPASDRSAWRADSEPHPSPELWRGSADHGAFQEHHEALAPSRLGTGHVLQAVLAAAE